MAVAGNIDTDSPVKPRAATAAGVAWFLLPPTCAPELAPVHGPLIEPSVRPIVQTDRTESTGGKNEDDSHWCAAWRRLTAFASDSLGPAAGAPARTSAADAGRRPRRPRIDKDIKLTGCVKAGASAGSFELDQRQEGHGRECERRRRVGQRQRASPAGASKNVKLSAGVGCRYRGARRTHGRSAGSWARARARPLRASARRAAPRRPGEEIQRVRT